MKLFGLVEMMNIEQPLFIIGTINLNHHTLYKKLSEYDSNLSVGLELTENGTDRLDFENAWFETPKVHLDLLDYFKKSNKVYFLESVAYYKSIADIVNEIVSIKKRSSSASSFSFGYDLEQQVDSKRIEDLQIKLNYMNTVGKEKSLIESISQYKPELIFLGDGHALRFFKNKDDLFKTYGINIEEYWREKVVKSPTEKDIVDAAALCDEKISMEELLSNDVELELEKVESPEQIEEDPEIKQIEELYKNLQIH